MKKITILLLFFIFTIGCGIRVAIKKDYNFSSIHRIAVLNFSNYYTDINSGRVVADEFVHQLIKSGFDVVERSELDTLLREKKLAGTTNISVNSAKSIGKILGVDTFITGTVTKFIPDNKERIYFKDEQGNIQEETFLIEAEVGVTARMIDVNTGYIVWSASYNYEGFDIESSVSTVVSTLLNSLNKLITKYEK